jgi:hypothetical protein
MNMQALQTMVYANSLKKNNLKLKIYITALVLVMAVITGYVLKNTVFRETIAVNGQEQAKALQPGDYVSMTSDRYFYTGFVDKKKNKTVGYYYLVEAGDAFFIVRSSKDFTERSTADLRTPEEFKGGVQKDANRQENVSALRKMGVPQEIIAANLMPFMVSDKNTNSKVWMLFLLIPLGFFVYGQAEGVRSNRRNRERLAKYSDIASAEQAFDSEFATGYNYAKINNVHMTQNWLFSSETNKTFLMPINEVMWIYKTVTQHKTNGIPTGKSYKLTIVFSDGSSSEINTNEKNCDALVENLAQRGRNIIIGFSDELNEMWSSNPQQFIESWKADRAQR